MPSVPNLVSSDWQEFDAKNEIDNEGCDAFDFEGVILTSIRQREFGDEHFEGTNCLSVRNKSVPLMLGPMPGVAWIPCSLGSFLVRSCLSIACLSCISLHLDPALQTCSVCVIIFRLLNL